MLKKSKKGWYLIRQKDNESTLKNMYINVGFNLWQEENEVFNQTKRQ